MKFRTTRKYASYAKKEFSIVEALTFSMDDYGYGYGGIEENISRIGSQADSIGQVLANLIQTLYERGVIPEETIIAMLPSFEKINDDNV